MKNCKAIIRKGTTLLALASLLAGCAREISHKETTKVNSDGTVKKEKTVTQSSDGTVTKTEESKTTKP
jgi:ABC-type Fe3+-hydroxamate transport system substrate-binding protein